MIRVEAGAGDRVGVGAENGNWIGTEACGWLLRLGLGLGWHVRLGLGFGQTGRLGREQGL